MLVGEQAGSGVGQSLSDIFKYGLTRAVDGAYVKYFGAYDPTLQNIGPGAPGGVAVGSTTETQTVADVANSLSLNAKMVIAAAAVVVVGVLLWRR